MCVYVMQEDSPTPYEVLVGSLPHHPQWPDHFKMEEEEGAGATYHQHEKVLCVWLMWPEPFHVLLTHLLPVCLSKVALVLSHFGVWPI